MPKEVNLAALLKNIKTVALVGASDNLSRPSYQVGLFLASKGINVFGVNPKLAGQSLFGQKVVANLAALQTPVEMIDIFRNSDAVSEIVDEALALPKQPKIIWMQLGVENTDAAKRAEAHGLTVIMNKCPKIEWRN